MVDLGAQLLDLVAPLRPGDARVDGWTLVGASTELCEAVAQRVRASEGPA